MMDASIYHSPDEPSPQDLAADTSTTGSRARAIYRRKRAVQACLTCRARKSRCDGRRPQCAFCAGINSDCRYPDIEATTLDKGSAMILERMKAMEDNIFRRLDLLPNTAGHSRGVRCTALQTTDHTVLPTGALWPNGDVILMWKSIELLVLQLPEPHELRSFQEEFRYSQSSKSSPVPISPTVFQSGQELESRFRGAISNDEVDRLMHPEMLHSLMCSYITHIHSKSPILDLPALSNTAELIATRRINPAIPSLAELPLDVEAADIAIVFFVLALAQVASRRYSQNGQMKPDYYVQLALPWLGLSQFGDVIKNLQANLLLSSYYMWTLNHWDAWCVIDSTASRAEKVLLANQSVINDPLNHRIMWAVAKMHFELLEECQIYRPQERFGKLMALVSTTSLPQPPDKPFEWPGVHAECESDTWYYYLAETSSRRLIERIKVELYSGSYDGSAEKDLTAIYRLACELEKQIDQWFESLPASFNTSSQMSTDNDDTNQTTPRPSAKDGMKKILLNRKNQSHMLVFRPFLEFLAGEQLEVLILPASQREHLLLGAQKCITYTLNFLQRQPRLAERHYGSWLLARNVWSGGLTLVAACNTPIVLRHLSAEPTAMQANTSSESDQLSYSNMMSTGELACSLLRQWEHESPSLSHCATILSSLIIETRRRHGQ